LKVSLLTHEINIVTASSMTGAKFSGFLCLFMYMSQTGKHKITVSNAFYLALKLVKLRAFVSSVLALLKKKRKSSSHIREFRRDRAQSLTTYEKGLPNI
jgi:hypothetical protein